MYFKQEKDIKIKDNDIYILEIVNNHILINNNYQGISIYNNVLEKIKDIFIFEDLTIYSVYKDFIGKKVLLYCPDNECIIYVNLDSSAFSIIPLPNQDIIFSSIYYWKENFIILTTYSNEFYTLHKKEKIIRKINKKEIKKNYPEFYNFWLKSKNYKILKTYPQELKLLFDNPTLNKIGLLEFKQNKKFFIQKPKGTEHDIEYIDNKFMFIQENKILLLSKTKLIGQEANKNEIFLRGRFLNINTIIVLSSIKNDSKRNTITKYKIT